MSGLCSVCKSPQPRTLPASPCRESVQRVSQRLAPRQWRAADSKRRHEGLRDPSIRVVAIKGAGGRLDRETAVDRDRRRGDRGRVGGRTERRSSRRPPPDRLTARSAAGRRNRSRPQDRRGALTREHRGIGRPGGDRDDDDSCASKVDAEGVDEPRPPWPRSKRQGPAGRGGGGDEAASTRLGPAQQRRDAYSRGDHDAPQADLNHRVPDAHEENWSERGAASSAGASRRRSTVASGDKVPGRAFASLASRGQRTPTRSSETPGR